MNSLALLPDRQPPTRTTTLPEALEIARGRVAVLVPAHNEQADIADTITSLQQLSLPPDDIVVVSDNSTDKTVAIAQAMGVTVFETKDNQYKKAGALNTGFRHLVAQGTIPEFLITMDADTIFDKDFVFRGLRAMRADPKVGVLSAVCRGKNGLVPFPVRRTRPARHLKTAWYSGLVSRVSHLLILLMVLFNKCLIWMQQIEYARAGTARVRNNIHTMSGAGSIIRAEALLDLLVAHREQGHHSVFLYQERPDNLVEDFALTLDLKELGWVCTNNAYVIAHTDLMRTLPALLAQRTRWVRGTIDELRLRKFGQGSKLSSWMLIIGIGSIPLFYLWPVLITMSALRDNASIIDFWLLFLMGIYQAVITHKLGWKAMLASFILIPDLLYSVIRHYWVISAVVLSLRRNHQEWE